ncbi:O-antigen ligase family protein [Vibrio mangrovi]|uniref:O-Antigen ligase n=1 Tax=Vibrio mangrovi TaxID=474394 RepID=A0A1Y6IZ78_9VIBR|nr:O-antigen ligase family protein [Vibrio mangrovi]MDW6003101.1 O-antigen ligase family protein [Vibrio mangrovi]SMS01343.1 O-Antigen ligase [Vibrio mangrovi]
MTYIERWCWYSLLVMLVWLPIPLASHRMWSWSIFEVWISLQTLLLTGALWYQFPWQRIRRFVWLLAPLGIFQLWVAIQALPLPVEMLSVIAPDVARIYIRAGADIGSLSYDRYATYTGLLKGIAYTLFALNAVILIHSVQRVKMVLYALVVSGTFQAFYGALTVLLQTHKSWVFGLPQGTRATGTFVYFNHFANYLVLCLCMGTGLIISQLHQSESGSWHVRIRRWFSALLSAKMMIRLCLIMMVIALIMTRSRMGNAAFFAVTVIGGVVALFFYKKRPRALTALIISIMVIDTFLIGTLFGLEKVKQRLESTSVETETRDQAVQWSLDMIRDYPFTGTGLGSFYSTFPGYSHYNIGYYNYAHNDYVQFAAETGIPAVVVLSIPVFVAVWLCFKAIRSRHSKTLKGTALGCFMGILAMVGQITVDFHLQAPANAVTLILILVLSGCTIHIQVRPAKPDKID